MNVFDIVLKVERDGGVTLTPDLEEFDVDNGYMVSLSGYELRVDDNGHGWAIITAVLPVYQEIAENRLAYIGLWKDNDKIYLDISTHVIDRDEAIEFARVNGQIAIWDVENGKEIRVTGDADDSL